MVDQIWILPRHVVDILYRLPIGFDYITSQLNPGYSQFCERDNIFPDLRMYQAWTSQAEEDPHGAEYIRDLPIPQEPIPIDVKP